MTSEEAAERLKEEAIEAGAHAILADDVLNDRAAHQWGRYPLSDDWYLSNSAAALVVFEERAATERNKTCICDTYPGTTEGPNEECPLHGRPLAEWIARADRYQDESNDREAVLLRVRQLISKSRADLPEKRTDGAHAIAEFLHKLDGVLGD